MNARFREEPAGLVSEALSDWIQVAWRPIEETAMITFETNRYLKSGDQYITRMEGMEDSITIDHIGLAGRSYEINGKVISGIDMDIFVRLLYDDLYNELHAPQPEPEPEPEPDPDEDEDEPGDGEDDVDPLDGQH